MNCCSFCKLSQSEVQKLVTCPTGECICTACIRDSFALISDPSEQDKARYVAHATRMVNDLVELGNLRREVNTLRVWKMVVLTTVAELDEQLDHLQWEAARDAY